MWGVRPALVRKHDTQARLIVPKEPSHYRFHTFDIQLGRYEINCCRGIFIQNVSFFGENSVKIVRTVLV